GVLCANTEPAARIASAAKDQRNVMQTSKRVKFRRKGAACAGAAGDAKRAILPEPAICGHRQHRKLNVHALPCYHPGQQRPSGA
ncbi:MAG TPA: hypothetical protein VLB69_05700, partial [Rudaea sp.]|nr:hypothetical protein [Rudaea sp.]